MLGFKTAGDGKAQRIGEVRGEDDDIEG